MLTFKAPYRDRYGMVSIQGVVKVGEARDVDCGALWHEGEMTERSSSRRSNARPWASI